MSLPNSGKLLAIDLGTRRTGLAITDEAQTVAFPRDEFEYNDLNELYLHLEELIKTETVVGILIGLPLNMQGEDSQQTTWTRGVILELQNRFKIPIQPVDERWSSQQARSRMTQSKHVDSESARILLEGFLQ